MNNRLKIWLIFSILFLLLISIAVMILWKGSAARESVKNLATKTIQVIGQSRVSAFIVHSLLQDNESPKIVNQAIVVNDDLLAFTDKLVYRSGQIPKLLIRAYQEYSVEIFIVENDGVLKPISKKWTQKGDKLGPIIFDTFNGFNSSDFDLIKLDSVNKSGWHQAIVASGTRKTYIPFFVEKLNNKDVLFVESTDTLKAYVSANGFSTYYSPRPKKLMGEFTRPFGYPINYKIKFYDSTPNDVDCTDHLINADFVLKAALGRLSINYDVVSDEFFDYSHDLKRYRMIVLGTHNEYWNSGKIERIKAYVEQGGGSLLILGGNTAWRWVARSSAMDVIWGDGVLKDDKRYQSFLNSILGSYYDSRGYNTYAPFQLVDGMHLLEDSLKTTKDFGVGSRFEGCKNKITGASGFETDKIYKKAQGFTVIANGLNKGGSGGAQTVYKRFENEGRGQVLNFGSLALWHRIDDPVIQSLIRNFYKESKKQNN
jgi:hypothetical protein